MLLFPILKQNLAAIDVLQSKIDMQPAQSFNDLNKIPVSRFQKKKKLANDISLNNHVRPKVRIKELV